METLCVVQAIGRTHPERSACMRALIACLSLFVGSAVLAAEPLPMPRIPAPQPHVAGEPYRVGGEVTPPEKIGGEAPVYTEEARQARVQGVVILEAIIDEKGDVANIRVLKQLPLGLDKVAVAAVSTWKFKPATRDGVPVKVYYTLTVNFQMDDSPDPLALLGLLAHERAARPRAADAADVGQIEGELTAGRRTFDEALRWAEGYRGESRAYALAGLGGYAWRQATSGAALDPAARNLLLDQGIEAEDQALATAPDLPEAMLFKALLLKEKSSRASDLAERTALFGESGRLTQAAAEIYRKAHPPEPAAP
jgi:TonB family protein